MPGSLFEFPPDAEFEWDERKSQQNLRKHGFDFDDAIGIFESAVLLLRSDRKGETRWLALGQLSNRVIAVVFTQRGDIVRVISARRARKNEERNYRQTASL